MIFRTLAGSGGAGDMTVSGVISYGGSGSLVWSDETGGRSENIWEVSSITATKNSLVVCDGYEPRGEGYPQPVRGCELIYGGQPENSKIAMFRVTDDFEIGN